MWIFQGDNHGDKLQKCTGNGKSAGFHKATSSEPFGVEKCGNKDPFVISSIWTERGAHNHQKGTGGLLAAEDPL